MYTRPKALLPNRVATVLIMIAGVVAAALPAAAGMNWESTAGVLAGLGAVAAATLTWLRGWQQNEQTNLDEYRSAPAEEAATTPEAAATTPVKQPQPMTDDERDELVRLRAELDRVRAELEAVRLRFGQLSTEITDMSKVV